MMTPGPTDEDGFGDSARDAMAFLRAGIEQRFDDAELMLNNMDLRLGAYALGTFAESVLLQVTRGDRAAAVEWIADWQRNGGQWR